ncbi:hypothetical protein NM688_g6775 [Phlebia brevispora]|uniref:Uncharacterized protein n=1 Tax=Phlebia brevispora TaxID=194682 RepID=A0ACC1SCN8_9APHY|nr:hypothetical protein NM688_g6775 [Phlebia brevispora]
MVTWAKTYQHVKAASAAGVSVGFSSTLLRYGTFYFAAMTVVTALNAAATFVPPLQPYNTPLSMVSNLLISRFLINLRQVDTGSEVTRDATRSSHFSVPNFRAPTLASIIGNMGEVLGDDEENIEDEKYASANSRTGEHVASADPDTRFGETVASGIRNTVNTGEREVRHDVM